MEFPTQFWSPKHGDLADVLLVVSDDGGLAGTKCQATTKSGAKSYDLADDEPIVLYAYRLAPKSKPKASAKAKGSSTKLTKEQAKKVIGLVEAGYSKAEAEDLVLKAG